MRAALRTSYRLKPPGPCPINWSHPLTNGLLAFWYALDSGTVAWDAVTQTIAPLFGSGLPQRADTNWGIGAKFSGLSATYFGPAPSPQPQRLQPPLPVSVFGIGEPTTPGTSTIVMMAQDDTNYNGIFWAMQSNGVAASFGDNVGSNRATILGGSGGSFFGGNRLQCVGASIRAANNMNVYLDGVDMNGGYSGGASSLVYNGSAQMALAGYQNYPSAASTTNADGIWVCSAFWNRNLTADEHMLLALDPFGIFAQAPVTAYGLSGSPSTGTTVGIRTRRPVSKNVKPALNSPVNVSHPLAQGLNQVWIAPDQGHQPVEALSGAIMNIVGSTLPGESMTPYGRAPLLTVAGATYYQAPPRTIWQTPYPTSLAVLMVISSTANYTVPFSTYNDPSEGLGGFALSVRATGAWNAFCATNPGNGLWSYAITPTGILFTNTLYLLSYSWRSLTDLTMYRNGVVETQATTAFGNSVGYGANGGPAIGSWQDAGGDNYKFDGSVIAAFVWNRNLSDAEHLAMWNDPFQMFGESGLTATATVASNPAWGGRIRRKL